MYIYLNGKCKNPIIAERSQYAYTVCQYVLIAYIYEYNVSVLKRLHVLLLTKNIDLGFHYHAIYT